LVTELSNRHHNENDFLVEERKITRILRCTLTAIYESLENLITWPTETEFEEIKSKWNEHLPNRYTLEIYYLAPLYIFYIIFYCFQDLFTGENNKKYLRLMAFT